MGGRCIKPDDVKDVIALSAGVASAGAETRRHSFQLGHGPGFVPELTNIVAVAAGGGE